MVSKTTILIRKAILSHDRKTRSAFMSWWKLGDMFRNWPYIFTLAHHRCRWVLSSFYASVHPAVCHAVCLSVPVSTRPYICLSGCLSICAYVPNDVTALDYSRISGISLTFGGVMHSNITQITFLKWPFLTNFAISTELWNFPWYACCRSCRDWRYRTNS